MLSKYRIGLAMLGVFTQGFNTITWPISFNISQLFVILLFISCLYGSFKEKKRIPLKKYLLTLFSFVFFSSAIINYNLIDYDNFKMFLGLIIYVWAYYLFLLLEKNNIQSVIKSYFNFTFIFSVIAIIQEIGFFLNIPVLYDLSYLWIRMPGDTSGNFLRVNSLCSEPAHYVSLMMPSIFLILLSIFKKNKTFPWITKWKSIIMISGFILTFSLIGYFSVLIILVYFQTTTKTNVLKKIAVSFFIIVASISSFIYSENIQGKISSVSTDRETITSSSNASFFAMYSNYEVALEALIESPFWGSGINTHRFNYEKYMHGLYSGEYFILNNNGDSSFYTHIPSEFGLIGIIVFIFPIIKYRIKRKNIKLENLKYLNEMSILFLLTNGLRNGAYLDATIWLFFGFLLVTFNLNYRYQNNYSNHLTSNILEQGKQPLAV